VEFRRICKFLGFRCGGDVGCGPAPLGNLVLAVLRQGIGHVFISKKYSSWILQPLKIRTFRCVEMSGTEYLVMRLLFLGSSTLEDENIRLRRNVGNQISCDASSLLGQFDP
jgi:hypothetical protein